MWVPIILICCFQTDSLAPRLQGGKDSASERYIFTQLNQVVKDLYIPYDTKVLNYLDDDGTPVEPEFYAPIIPMILVNGTKGIGTGFSN